VNPVKAVFFILLCLFDLQLLYDGEPAGRLNLFLRPEAQLKKPRIKKPVL
jgi:hypothetical protein